MKDFYDRIWERRPLDYFPERWKGSKIQEFIETIRPYLKGKTCDVGCGEGYVTAEINKIVPTTGLDISNDALRIARNLFPNIDFIQGDILNLPFKDNSFDTIVAVEFIEHVIDTKKMFSEFKRVLKPGGNLIMLVPEFNFLKNLLITLFYWEETFDPNGEHIRFYSFKSLKNVLEENSFELIFKQSDKRFGIIPITMTVVAKNKKVVR